MCNEKIGVRLSLSKKEWRNRHKPCAKLLGMSMSDYVDWLLNHDVVIDVIVKARYEDLLKQIDSYDADASMKDKLKGMIVQAIKGM